jgi:hypothetical protein
MTSATTRRSLARWAVSTLAVTGIALGGVACTAAPDPLAASTLDTVGHLDGSAALVAVVAGEGTIAAYVCDGDTALGERFTGTVQGNHAELRSANDALLLVDLGQDATTGTFITAGRPPQHFTTTAATTDEAGYFTAEGPTPGGTFSAGWIELDDGTQTGVVAGEDGGRRHKDRAPRLHHHRKPGTAGRPATGNPGPIPPDGVIADPGGTVTLPDEGRGVPTGTRVGDSLGVGPGPGGIETLPDEGRGVPTGTRVGDQLGVVPGPGGTATLPDEGRGDPTGTRVGDSLAVGSGGTETVPDEGRGDRLRSGPPAAVTGTVDEPGAQVAGVGPVAARRVVPTELKIRRPR